MEHTRPSIIATLLWAFGIFIIILTVYSMFNWWGWTQNLNDFLLVIVAFAAAVNAIATGALIDMHTIKRKKENQRTT
jgi:hypothetical protein